MVKPRRQSVFIGAFLALQILLPLHYYVLRADRYDERFAWRMFSPERMVSCTVRFNVGESRVISPRNMRTEFHEAWAQITQRGRVVVIEAMAQHLCKKYKEPVRVNMTCRTVDGRTETRGGGWDLCVTGRL